MVASSRVPQFLIAVVTLLAVLASSLATSAHAQTITYRGGSIYDLDPPAQQSTRVLEAISGADDMQAVSDLAETDILRTLARPVGRFTYATATGELGHCTASLIADDLILTNHHCVRDATEAMLWMGYLIPLSRQGVAQYAVELPPVEADETLDYAILRVRGAPGTEWGQVEIAPSEAGPRQSLFIVHHPGGFAQRISLGRCRANDPARHGDDLLHVCDTTGGSSGAPIFDNGSRKVVALHYSAVDLKGLNAGKRMARLVEASARLRDLAREAGGMVEKPSEPPLSPAAREWSAIRDTASCAILDAFLQAHGDSPFARYAAARRGELNCDSDRVAARTQPEEALEAGDQSEAPQCQAPAIDVMLASNEIVCRAPGGGESFRDCHDCPEMVVVPAGSFMMGSPPDEERRESDEDPMRRVVFADAFAVGKFEVTFDEWQICSEEGGCDSNPDPSDEGWGKGRRPVINVSWEDAQNYIFWLNFKLGLGDRPDKYRLLSEAEWEYAARAGTTTPFAFGASLSSDQANYDANHTYGGGPHGLFREETISVGSLAPNAFGLYHMHGNVWEWVEDCYSSSYSDAPSNGSPSVGGRCLSRVLRGGSWNIYPMYLRSANRFEQPAGIRKNEHGFRLARTLIAAP